MLRVVAHLAQGLDLLGEGLDEMGVDGVDLEDLERDRAAGVDLRRPIHGGERPAADLDDVA